MIENSLEIPMNKSINLKKKKAWIEIKLEQKWKKLSHKLKKEKRKLMSKEGA